MLDALIGLLSPFVLLICYRLFERKRIERIGYIKYLFIIIVLFAAFVVSPSERLFEWAVWLLFFYTMLDDLRTKTVFVPIYVLILFLLFLQDIPPSNLLFAAIVMGIFLLFVRLTKETFLCYGDVYCLFPMSFWFGWEVFVIIVLAFFLAASVLPYVSMFYKGEYFAFTPFLIIGAIIIQKDFYSEWFFIGSLLLNLIAVVILYLKSKSKNKFKK